MKSITLRTVTILTMLILTACLTEESAWMREPKVTPTEINDIEEPPGFVSPAKAEIIFVIDNSESMGDARGRHITNVSNNIERFVKAFTHQNPLEYRLAVMPVYDTRTYDSPAYIEKFGKTDGLGKLAPVKSSDNSVVANKYFISSTDSDRETLLRHTLKVDVKKLEEGGPEFEELFSPVAALYGYMKKQVNAEALKTQSGFFYGEDSYKIIFFVTDASDASDWSPTDLYYSLVARSGGDESKVMAFGAIIPSSASTKNCTPDPGQRAYKLEEFLSLTRSGSESSNIASLCGNFGDKFAEFGKSIRERTVSRRIPLPRIPVINSNRKSCPQDIGGNPDEEETLRVFYGTDPNPCHNQEIYLEVTPEMVGFRYDPRTNSIILNPKLELNPVPGAKISWKLTAIDPRDWQNGKVRRTRF